MQSCGTQHRIPQTTCPLRDLSNKRQRLGVCPQSSHSSTYFTLKLLIPGYSYMREEPPPHRDLFIKNVVFILTRLNFSHLQSTLHLMQYAYRDIFPTAQTKQFSNVSILMPFSASAVFCFTSSTSAKRSPLRTFFIQGSKIKSCSRQDRVSRESGARGHAVFGQKLLNTQHGVGRYTR